MSCQLSFSAGGGWRSGSPTSWWLWSWGHDHKEKVVGRFRRSSLAATTVTLNILGLLSKIALAKVGCQNYGQYMWTKFGGVEKQEAFAKATLKNIKLKWIHTSFNCKLHFQLRPWLGKGDAGLCVGRERGMSSSKGWRNQFGLESRPELHSERLLPQPMANVFEWRC